MDNSLKIWLSWSCHWVKTIRPCSLVSGFGVNLPFWKDPKYLLACWKHRVGYWQGNGKGMKAFFFKKGREPGSKHFENEAHSVDSVWALTAVKSYFGTAQASRFKFGVTKKIIANPTNRQLESTPLLSRLIPLSTAQSHFRCPIPLLIYYIYYPINTLFVIPRTKYKEDRSTIYSQ